MAWCAWARLVGSGQGSMGGGVGQLPGGVAPAQVVAFPIGKFFASNAHAVLLLSRSGKSRSARRFGVGQSCRNNGTREKLT